MYAKSLFVAITSLLPLISAIPAPIDAGINTSVHMDHSISARKVPEYKAPWSMTGTCNANGACAYKGSDFPARCKNSKCDISGPKCVVAYSDTAPTDFSSPFAIDKKAKCPTNTAGYEWEWPVIDHAWKDAWDSYKQCKNDAKSIGDKKARGDAMAKCEEIHGGPA